MTRTLRRLARIQRIQQDEARTELVGAEQARDAQHQVLQACHDALADSCTEHAEDLDDLTRRHSFALRQEMRRRQLQARVDELDADVEHCRAELRVVATRVKTTERVTDLLEARDAEDAERRLQRQLDEVGLLGWMRSVGEVA